jgi:type VI secretion system protein ImpK
MATQNAWALEAGPWPQAGSDGQRHPVTPAEPDYEGRAVNPLVAAANPLLVLIPQIRASETHPSVQMLREHLVDEIRQFELRAQQAGIANETILGARYCLCTALDEAAALTTWGGNGAWSAGQAEPEASPAH